MRFFQPRSALVVGAIGLAVAVGAVGIFAGEQARAVFAQDDDNEYHGIVEALPASGVVGTWYVSGRAVTVTEATDVDLDDQPLATGLWVEIEGTDQADGSILASEIDGDDDGGPAGSQNDDDDNGTVGDVDDDGATDDDDDNGATGVTGDDDDDDGAAGQTGQSDDD